MLLQKAGDGESLPACVTRPRFLARMSPFVDIQVGRQLVGLPAQIAAKGTLVGVQPDVDLQISNLSEGLFTYSAPVRSLSGVDPQMNPQAVLTGELLLADRTWDLCFGHMVLLVPLQVRQVDKGLPTLGAEILAVTNVVAHVSLQQAGNKESLPTALTHVRAISSVPALMVRQLESRGEDFAAVLAGERHLACVALHVSFEIGGLREALVADVTIKGFLPAVGENVFRQALQFSETLATLATSIRTSCTVGLEVVVEECLRTETFVARRAEERLLSCMNSFVVHQLGLIGEALITHTASKPVT